MLAGQRSWELLPGQQFVMVGVSIGSGLLTVTLRRSHSPFHLSGRIKGFGRTSRNQGTPGSSPGALFASKDVIPGRSGIERPRTPGRATRSAGGGFGAGPSWMGSADGG